jgi:hypothetical protein
MLVIPLGFRGEFCCFIREIEEGGKEGREEGRKEGRKEERKKGRKCPWTVFSRIRRSSSSNKSCNFKYTNQNKWKFLN